jgi:uncharacterized cupredoxin-like copper-binding protein
MNTTPLRVTTLGLAATAAALAVALPATAQKQRAAASINVNAYDIGYRLSAKSVSSGVVIFKVKNTGKLQHDFQIDRRKTKMLSGGKSDTLRLTLRKGTYAYKCTVPGHAAAGMKGVLKVT